MKRRNWLIVAVLLIAAATLLMVYAEEPAPPPPDELEVNFPRRLNEGDRKRMMVRRTLPAAPAPTPAPDAPTEPRLPRDPLLTALASGVGSAMVIEANAIRNSPVGELLLECLLNAGQENPIEEIREKAGVDVLQDLDRVAMTENGVMMTGHFEKAHLDELFGGKAQPESYGQRATFYRPPGADGGVGDGVFVSWDGQLMMFADDEAQARAAVDRLEGRAEGEPVIREDQTYGEIYGVLSVEDFTRMLPPEEADLAQKFKDAANQIELHVDTARDVGMVANVVGRDSAQAEDLGRSLGGLLAGARLKAKYDGRDDLVELLDLAKVRPRGDSFGLEVGMPLEFLQERLAFCKEKNFGEKRRQERLKERRERMDAGGSLAAPQPEDTPAEE